MSIVRDRVEDDSQEEHADGSGGAHHAQRRLFRDAYALTASTLSSAAAGFLTYILSARLFPTDVVGHAGALTSAMLMLSGASQLDLSNALHRFLPGSGRSAKRLIFGAYGVAGTVSLIVGFIFAAIDPVGMFTGHRWLIALLFGMCVALWSLFNLQDQVLMGLGASILVPLENTVFGFARIGLLISLIGGTAYAILATWVAPVIVLLVCISIVIVKRVYPAHVVRSANATTIWDFRTVSRFVANGYIGAVTSLVVANLLPVLVLGHLGAETNAYFYMAWIVSSNVELIMQNFGVSVVVQGATTPDHVPHLLRAALKKQVMLLGGPILIMLFFAHPILLIFGEEYTTAAPVLRFLAVGLMFRMAWGLYLPYCRISGHIRRMAVVQVSSSILIITGTLGGLYGFGLTGIGVGYLIAHVTMASVLSPELLRMFRGNKPKHLRPLFAR